MINNFITYLLFTFLILYFFSYISYKLKLVDIPGKRKKHLEPTAYTGGLALSIVFLIGIKLFNFSDQALDLIVSTSFLISIVGFIDDKYDLNIGSKLSLQAIPIIYLIIFGNISVNSLGNYLNYDLELSSFSIPFTILCVFLVINASNYFDGIDGGLCTTFLSTITIFFLLISEYNIKLFLTIITIPIIIFLFFNFSLFNLPKLFLGDSGSLFLGFVLSFLLIYFENKNLLHPVLIAWSIALLVYEFLSVNIIRIVNKRKIFKPGSDHLHYFILYKTKSVILTNIFMFLTNIILFGLGYFSFQAMNSFS